MKKSQLSKVVNGVSMSLLASNTLLLAANGDAADIKTSWNTSVNLYESATGIPCSLSQWIQSRGSTQDAKHNQVLQDCYEKLEQESKTANNERDWHRLIILTQRIIEIKEYALVKQNIYLDKAGVGIVFAKNQVEGYPVAGEIIKGLGADKAGIRKGAIITHINTRKIRNITLEELIKQVRGKVGSEVTLTFKLGEVSRTAKITRRPLKGDEDNRSAFWRENSRLYNSYVATKQIEKAIEIFPALLKSNTDKHGLNSTVVAELRLTHAKLLNISNQFRESQKHLEAASAILRKLGLTALEVDIETNSLSLRNFIGIKDYQKVKRFFLRNYRILEAQNKRLTKKQIEALIDDISFYINSGACTRVQEIRQHECLQYTTLGYTLIDKTSNKEAKHGSTLLTAHASTLVDAKQTDEAIEVLELQRRYPQIKTESLLLNFDWRANLLSGIGKYWEAEKDFLAAVNVATEQGGVGSSLAINSKMNLAKFYSRTGQYTKAQRHFQNIISQLDKIGNDEKSDELRLKIFNEYISLLLQINNRERITEIGKRVTRIIKKYPNDIGAATAGKALQAEIAIANQSFVEATHLIAEYINGLSRFEAANKGEDGYKQIGLRVYLYRFRISEAYKKLAIVQSVIGKNKLAKTSIRKAIQVAKTQQAPFDYLMAGYYNTQSRIYMSNGEYRAALESAERALAVAEKRGTEGVLDSAESNLLIGGIEAIQGRHNQAGVHFDSFIRASFEGLAKKVWSAPSELKRSLNEIAIADTNVLYQNFGRSQRLNQIALKARVNMHSFAKEVELIQGTELQRQPTRLAREIEILKAKLGSERIDNSQKEKLQAQISEMEFRASSLLPIQMRRMIELPEIARALPNNGKLIEIKKYYAFPSPGKITPKNQSSPKYAAFILDKTGQVERIELGSAKEIDSQVDKVLDTSSENLADSKSHLMKLSDIILKPLVMHLRPGTEVFLVPDSKMNLVPFGALTMPNTQTPLASYVYLRLLGSGRDILASDQKGHQTRQSVVVANPDFGHTTKDKSSSTQWEQIQTERAGGKSAYLQWDMLPSTQAEGRNIMDLLEGRMISGKDATTDAIKHIISPLVLHVATHGYAGSVNHPDEHPRRYRHGADTTSRAEIAIESGAGFVLAGANTPVDFDDGVISLGEAASLRLNGTELVVLSACTTAWGSINDGDGVFGLQRALAVAGARSTLLSLWKVDDAATAEFMTRFYQRLKAGEGRADALASVQREFRTGIGGKHDVWKEPYYWAAWQLVGDWRPIKGL